MHLRTATRLPVSAPPRVTGIIPPAAARARDAVAGSRRAAPGIDIAVPRRLPEAETRGIRIYIPTLTHELRFGPDSDARSLCLPGDSRCSPSRLQPTNA